MLDKDRRPVRGLKPEDFTVVENGKTQRIVTVTEMAGAERDPAPSAWMRHVPPDVSANDLTDMAGDGRFVAIVMDDWNVPFDDHQLILGAREVGRYLVDQLSSIGRGRGHLSAAGGQDAGLHDRSSEAHCRPSTSSIRPRSATSRSGHGARAGRRRHAAAIRANSDAQRVPALTADGADAGHRGRAACDGAQPPQDRDSGEHRFAGLVHGRTRLPGRARGHHEERVPPRSAGQRQYLQRRSGRRERVRGLPAEPGAPRRPARRYT